MYANTSTAVNESASHCYVHSHLLACAMWCTYVHIGECHTLHHSFIALTTMLARPSLPPARPPARPPSLAPSLILLKPPQLHKASLCLSCMCTCTHFCGHTEAHAYTHTNFYNQRSTCIWLVFLRSYKIISTKLCMYMRFKCWIISNMAQNVRL